MQAILLVEDDNRFRSMLAKFLRGEGHRVQEVESGLAALPLIEHCTFDLLITDYQLRDKIDGFDVLARFNQICPKKGKIVMSGDPDIQSRCDSAGASHLFKPFSLADLLAKIESVLPKPDRSLVNSTVLSELIDRARLQRAACEFAKETANRQRVLCTSLRGSDRQVQTSANHLKVRMEKLQRAQSFL
jgi:DNA-binding response OmpR family regulator